MKCATIVSQLNTGQLHACSFFIDAIDTSRTDPISKRDDLN